MRFARVGDEENRVRNSRIHKRGMIDLPTYLCVDIRFVVMSIRQRYLDNSSLDFGSHRIRICAKMKGFPYRTSRVSKPRHTPSPVAAHIGTRAIRVVINHTKILFLVQFEE